MEALRPPAVEWGVAARALAGEGSCGDAHLVHPFQGGVLVAAIDGLGHGREAASAARAAGAVLAAHPREPLEALFRRCHQALLATRGAVMSIASFDATRGLMTWLGVGNVEGVLVRPGRDGRHPEEPLLLRGGVVGGQLPPLEAATLQVSPDDTLVLATDGVRSGFAGELAFGRPPQRAAEAILARYAKGNDDALVLVARYTGAGP